MGFKSLTFCDPNPSLGDYSINEAFETEIVARSVAADGDMKDERWRARRTLNSFEMEKMARRQRRRR
jgi:hypothetical protein